MYSIAISAAAGLLVGLLVGLYYNIYAAIFTGLFVTLLAIYLFLRHFTGKLQEVQTRSLKYLEELQGQTSPNQQLVNQKFDLAIKSLEEGLRYKQWMILGESQINSQIGYIYYLKRDFDKALPYLKDSFVKNWVAQAMLAACLYRRKEYDQMEAALDKATKHNRKVPFLWGFYAWLEEELGKGDKVLELLQQGTEANPEDEALKSNLLNVQNKKKIKMAKFGDLWWQMFFETPPMKMMQPQHPRFNQFRRR